MTVCQTHVRADAELGDSNDLPEAELRSLADRAAADLEGAPA